MGKSGILNSPLLLDVFLGFLFVYRVCPDVGVCFFVHFLHLGKRNEASNVGISHNSEQFLSLLADGHEGSTQLCSVWFF